MWADYYEEIELLKRKNPEKEKEQTWFLQSSNSINHPVKKYFVFNMQQK